MKIPAMLTAVLALGFAHQAAAQTTNVVYLTGATAFRANVFNALSTSGVVFDGASTLQAARGGSSASGAARHLFLGQINGAWTYINCAWSGSETGIASIADETVDNDGVTLPGAPQTWLKTTTTGGFLSSNPAPGELEDAPRQGDLAFSDTSQDVSLTPRVPGTKTDLKKYGKVGAINFTLLKNINTSPNDAWLALTNMTLPQLNVLFAEGAVPAWFFTGNTNHTSYVYMVGRNKGSGTRANYLANTGYGTARSIRQFSIGGGVTDSQSDTLALGFVGNNGYEGGGGVTRALRQDGSCQQVDPFTGNVGWIAVSCVAPSDALASPFTTANLIALDGVRISNGAVRTGQYYMWGNQHLYGRFGISGFADTVGQKLFDGVVANIATAGSDPNGIANAISFDLMLVEKVTDTAFPTLK